MKPLSVMSWNVNSIRRRLDAVLQLLSTGGVDILLLQETKSPDDDFPKTEIEALGYQAHIHGQKSFNGVAILSRPELEITHIGLPGRADDQARYLEARLGAEYQSMRLASLYVPNGNPMGEDRQSGKFLYKCSWLEDFSHHALELLAGEAPVCLAGDYNIIPQARDVWDAGHFAGDALMAPFCRNLFGTLLAAGFADGLRLCQPEGEIYSFWDYQAGAFRKNHGIRIDHLLLSPAASDLLQESGALKATRQLEQPSDHVPVWARFGAQEPAI